MITPFQDVIEIENRYYVRAASSLADEQRHVLMQGDAFAIFDRHGDFFSLGPDLEKGIFYREARHLSHLVMKVNGSRPLLLSSSVREDNALLGIDATNGDLDLADGSHLLRGTVHFQRNVVLWEGSCYVQLEVENFGLKPVVLPLEFAFSADFADIFEVRGQTRGQRGDLRPPRVEGTTVLISYLGRDKELRETFLEFAGADFAVTADRARATLTLPAKGTQVCSLAIRCRNSREAALQLTLPFGEVLEKISGRRQQQERQDSHVYTSNEQFNNWVIRSRDDLHMLVSETPAGPYPYAGVPWYSTVFGRDGIVTALEYLWVNPELARGVLRYLASAQSLVEDALHDAEPGKIVHEIRRSEMAQTGEVPFRRYYGSVDATPLFLVLAAAYHERTDDRILLESLWPNIERALEWIDRWGDRDGDGFIEYGRRNPDGLIQQGWKDSHDSVFHADGQLADGPIALCEVQGYVYAAKQGIAAVADVLGHHAKAERLRKEAAVLRARFHEAFWCEELSTYALALDGNKQPCRVRTSNAGHCLFTGIVDAPFAARVMQTLTSKEHFSGWGVRTLATTERRYNPMSYHNGSIWPHDNALIGYGLIRSEKKEGALRMLTGLFDSTLFLDLARIPELFCGFERRPGKGPTLYPVACAPQAWSAGAVFLLLQAALGLVIKARENRVYLHYPALPEAIPRVEIRRLRIGGATVDLEFERRGQSVGVSLLRREGNVELVVIK